MSIVGPDSVMRIWLIVSRISALCFQRRHLIGLRVIHRKDECLSIRAMYYTSMHMNISWNSKSSDTSLHELTRNFCGLNGELRSLNHKPVRMNGE